MTKDEYFAQANEFHADYDRKIQALRQEYAESNAIAKVGDYISNDCITIRVKRISTFNSRYSIYYQIPPTITYHGIVCEKNGSMSRYIKKEFVFQHEIKTINGKDII